MKDTAKALGVLLLIIFGVGFAMSQIERHQKQVEQALIAEGYQNPSARQHMLVVCWGEKGRYGYKWTATRNGQRIEGEACSGGLFKETVIKP